MAESNQLSYKKFLSSLLMIPLGPILLCSNSSTYFSIDAILTTSMNCSAVDEEKWRNFDKSVAIPFCCCSFFFLPARLARNLYNVTRLWSSILASEDLSPLARIYLFSISHKATMRNSIPLVTQRYSVTRDHCDMSLRDPNIAINLTLNLSLKTTVLKYPKQTFNN